MDDGMKAGRETKHAVLADAVTDISIVVDRLDSVLNRLKGNPPGVLAAECKDPQQDSPPCFIEVLEISPDKIRKYCAVISDKLDELEDLLF